MNQLLPPGVLRVLFAIPFAVFGVMHFMYAENMQGMVPAYIPGGVIWVYITGACLILAALALVINKFAKIAGYLLALMLLVFILTIHLPALLGGDQNAMGSLLKDFSLMAAAMFVANFSSK
ncbi:DoxX family membrane protein [Daejeonella oryzae]|uniref:DoxX family membrane protein n=1 Tax=Daejeonella oryzae TaxID=1122943 RepID=UPI0003FE1F0D|nr:DoxX family membrane protein [Daejeonella oryzae]